MQEFKLKRTFLSLRLSVVLAANILNVSEASDKEPTPLDKMGEFRLIRHLTGQLPVKGKSVLKGIGDDAAVIAHEDEVSVVTTDMLCEGIHFNLVYNPPKHLGYKAVVVNLSDLYAMNATPRQITLSLAVSNRMSVEFLEAFYEGVKLACENYNVDLVGGDTASSQSGVVISLTAIGTANKEDVVYRSGAGENDLICVSGDLGAAYMGLQLLERERAVFESTPGVQPDLSGNDYVLERQLKPEARQDVFQAFREKKIRPTSMIDVSDGLSSDLLHLCTDSGLGCQIFEDRLPIDMTTVRLADEFKIAAPTAALNGGEDYELLFTARLEDHDKIKSIPEISIIGHMTTKNGSCNLITTGNSAVELKAQGWDSVRGNL